MEGITAAAAVNHGFESRLQFALMQILTIVHACKVRASIEHHNVRITRQPPTISALLPLYDVDTLEDISFLAALKIGDHLEGTANGCVGYNTVPRRAQIIHPVRGFKRAVSVRKGLLILTNAWLEKKTGFSWLSTCVCPHHHPFRITQHSTILELFTISNLPSTLPCSAYWYANILV